MANERNIKTLISPNTSFRIPSKKAPHTSFRWERWVVLDGKLSPEFPVNAGVPQGSTLGVTLFLLFINDVVLSKIAIHTDDTTVYSGCEKASDMWNQVEMSLDLKSYPRDAVEWYNLWKNSTGGKIQLVSIDQSANSGVIDIKIDNAILEEKSSLRLLCLPFTSKLDRGSYIVSIAKAACKKIGALLRSLKVFSPEV